MKISKLFNRLKRAPKKLYVGLTVLAVAAAIGIPLAVHADDSNTPWGPDRPTYDYNNPQQAVGSTTGPVFNSFINVPDYGDERNFTEVSANGQANWQKSVNVTPGEEIQVRAYVHNNANPATNGTNLDGIGVAQNTAVRFYIPSGSSNGFDVAAYVSASNATPERVYDTALVQDNNQPVSLSYVPGSAVLYNYGPFVNGTPVPDSVVADSGNGALIGYNALNGVFPGCFNYRATVIITLKVNAPALQFNKQVMSTSSTSWQKNVTANVGDTTSWLLNYEDVGTSNMNDVTLRDPIPAGLTLVPGSVTWFDSNHPNGQQLPDTALTSGGTDLGNYGPQGGGYIRFHATVNPNPTECTITNTGYASAANIPEESSQASVTINNCNVTPPTKPIATCNCLTADNVSGDIYKFTTSTTAKNGAVVSSYIYNFGDNTPTQQTDSATIEHTYPGPGTYNSSVTVNFQINNSGTETVSNSACTATVTIPTPPVTPVKPTTPATPVTPTSTTPTALVNTGPGSVVGIFAAATIAGAFLYRKFLIRRSVREDS